MPYILCKGDVSMALEKVTYVEGKTVITGKNLNDIQDEVIETREDVEQLKSQMSTLIEATVE